MMAIWEMDLCVKVIDNVDITFVGMIVIICMLCTLDVHECENGQDNCNANAVCSNTPGAFDCNCRSGLFGDGEICISKYITIIIYSFIIITECERCIQLKSNFPKLSSMAASIHNYRSIGAQTC